MNRLFLFVFLLFASSFTEMYAQSVMLKRNGDIKVFYGSDAWNEAYNAADNTSPVYSCQIKYGDGCELTYSTLDFSDDEDLLMWKYTGKDNIKDYCVYMSMDGEDYILYKADVTTTYVSFTLVKGHTYKFIVTARNENNQRTALDEEWSITVTK